MCKTNRVYRIAALLVASISVAGCATMDASECASANWHNLGIGDGEKGKKSSQHSGYQQDCGAFGINVDTKAYSDGWDTGIRRYCTRDSGYSVGARGAIYQHNCLAELEDSFYNGYQMGRSIHTKQVRVNSLRNQVQTVGDDLARNDLADEQRSSLADKRKRLKRQLEAATIVLLLTQAEARKHGF